MLKIGSASTRKTFQHDLLPYTELEAVYRDDKRYYILPDGTQVPSVTSVLGSQDHSHLDAWRDRIGHEEADKITRQAGIRGTAIHDLAEKYIRNDPDYEKGHMPINRFDFKMIKKFLDAHVDNIRGIEYPLYSYRLKTAGRTDLIAQWNGTNAIIDFKTSRRIKKEEWIQNYFMQATCYSLMAEELINIYCPIIVIIIAVDHEDPQLFVRERTEFTTKTLNLFENFAG